MKLLALTIGSYTIQLPAQIETANNHAGKYGVHIFQLAVDILGLAAIILGLLFLMYGGWKWIWSEGDKKKIEDARNTLVFSAIGLIIVALSFFIVNILGAFFNVPLLNIGG